MDRWYSLINHWGRDQRIIYLYSLTIPSTIHLLLLYVIIKHSIAATTVICFTFCCWIFLTSFLFTRIFQTIVYRFVCWTSSCGWKIEMFLLPVSVARRNSRRDSAARKIAFRARAVENRSTALRCPSAARAQWLILTSFFLFFYTIITSTERGASAPKNSNKTPVNMAHYIVRHACKPSNRPSNTCISMCLLGSLLWLRNVISTRNKISALWRST